MVCRQHADVLPWGGWQLGIGLARIAVAHAAVPLVAIGRATRLFSEEQAEFERYYRRWLRHFWGGFIEQWRKRPA